MKTTNRKGLRDMSKKKTAKKSMASKRTPNPAGDLKALANRVARQQAEQLKLIELVNDALAAQLKSNDRLMSVLSECVRRIESGFDRRIHDVVVKANQGLSANIDGFNNSIKREFKSLKGGLIDVLLEFRRDLTLDRAAIIREACPGSPSSTLTSRLDQIMNDAATRESR